MLPNSYIAPDANDVLVYTLDETSPPWANTGTGGSLDMDYAATVSVNPSNSAGLYSNAVSFPGPWNSENYIDTGAAGTTIGETAGDFTMSCFVYLRDYGGGAHYGCIANKSRTPDATPWAAPYHAVFMGYNNTNDGQFFVDVIIGGTEYTIATQYYIQLRRWTHLGITFEASTGIVRAYADGALVGYSATVGASSIDWGTHGPWTIGGEHDNSTGLNGVVDDFRVANVRRPASYFTDFGNINKNSYPATDASDQLVYTLNESTSPWANSGAAGALDLTVHSGGSGVIQEGGLYSGGIWLPGPNSTANFLTSGDAGTSVAEYGQNFTVSCWVWLRDYQGTNYGHIFGKAYRPDAGGWSSPYFAHRVGYANTNDGTLIFSVTIASVYYEIRPSTKIPKNTWCHVGYSWDGNSLRGYLSGKEITQYFPLGVGSTGSNADYGTHGAWILGGTPSGYSDTINGIIDDVRVANVVRDQDWFGQYGYFDLPAAESATSLQIAHAYPPDSPAQLNAIPSTVYRMRGFDANVSVNRVVYWNAAFVDGAAQQYHGSSGPVTDVVVVQKLS